MKNKTPFFSTFSTRLGHSTFVVLSLMAFVFFKERTLILDAALQSFIILRDNDFAIQVHRFGAAMTQIFPLVASRLGGSLSTILLAYSLSFVLVHWAMFWLCDRVLKQKAMALGIVLFNVFMVNHTFYWAQNELIQAISLGFVFWAYLLNLGKFAAFRWFDYPILFGLLITLAFFHPLVLFPFSFIAIYFLIHFYNLKSINNSLNLKSNTPPLPLSISLILAAFLGFLIIYFLKNQLLPNYYDPSARERFFLKNDELLNVLSNIKNSDSFKDLSAHLWTDFALLPLFLLGISIFYLIKKRILKLLLMWLSIIFYTLMVLISYREGGNWFHIESQYLPMSIFVIVPFVFELIPEFNGFQMPNAKDFSLTNKVPRFEIQNLTSNTPSVFGSKKGLIMGILMSFMVLVRLIDIYQTHDFYTKRVDYIGALLNKTKQFEGNKFIIEEKHINKTPLIQTWGLGYETLYYSALQSPDSMRSITVLVDSAAVSKALATSTIFQGIFTPTPYKQLNPRLFHQIDTVRHYKLLLEKDLEISQGIEIK
jgi:hypothetical protein